MSSRLNEITSIYKAQQMLPRSLMTIVRAWVATFAGSILLAGHAWANQLQQIDAEAMPGDQVQLRLKLSDSAPQPLTFTVDNPARISLDLADTNIALPSRRIDVKRGVLDTVNVAEANGRTRVVLNLTNMVPYQTRVEGDTVIVTVGSNVQGGNVSAATPAAASVPAAAPRAATLNNVDFRRGTDGSGRVVVQLSNARVSPDLKQEGGRIVVNFAKTSVADNLLKRLDVVDFATPVNTIDTVRVADGARIVITAGGDWEPVAYQSDDQYTIEVKPVVKAAATVLDRKEYKGERLTLNFQDIETRAVLQLLADTSGQNMVISDTVQGNVTLRLQNVPWDQALDIVMQTKGLDMRQEGNVILIGPAAEIAAREKELAAAKKDLTAVAPLRSEFLQVNYAKAADLAELIKGRGNSLMSERGSVTVDVRTNTLLLQDTADNLTDIRRLVSTLDIPIRQVLIEARIVIVSDDFSRELGARFGVNSAFNYSNSGEGIVGGTNYGVEDDGIVIAQPASAANSGGTGWAIGDPINRYMVNLPASDAAGKIALTLLDSSYIVDLELSAAQAEGRGEVVSAPKVITANQKEATIEQGREIPYLQSASSGAATIAFKRAVLALKVTPQITPDDRIILDLTVTKDSVGQLVQTTGVGGSASFVPSIDTRTITTQVLVNDGQTVVLGGILESEKLDTTRKVPLLGDIPVLGHLFKVTSKQDNKDELLVFVTPKILREGSAVY